MNQSHQKKQHSIVQRLVVLAVGIALFMTILLLPGSGRPAGTVALSAAGRRALASLVFALVLWVGEALPFHITGLFTMTLMAVLGVSSWPDLVKTGFGDESIVFFIGVLSLAAAMGRSGLAARLGRSVLRLTGDSTRAIIFGFLVAGAALAMWVTALAAAALMLPLAFGLLQAEGETPGTSRFGRALMMAVAWGPLIGACGTPAGSGSNPVVVRFMAELAHFNIGFVDWMAFGIPVVIILVPVAWLVITIMSPPERPRLTKAASLGVETAQQGAGSRRDEYAVAVVFLTVVALWLTAPLIAKATGFNPSVGFVAALGAAALFFPGVTSFRWKDIEKDIDWAGVMLIATGIALGTALYKSGAAAWVAQIAFGGIGGLSPFWRIAAVVIGVLAVKVVFSSNTLTGTIIVPLVLSLGPIIGIDPRLYALAAGFAANLAVILVTTSPVNVLPWSTGYFSIRDMLKTGLVFAPVAALAIGLVFSLVGGVYGLL